MGGPRFSGDAGDDVRLFFRSRRFRAKPEVRAGISMRARAVYVVFDQEIARGGEGMGRGTGGAPEEPELPFVWESIPIGIRAPSTGIHHGPTPVQLLHAESEGVVGSTSRPHVSRDPLIDIVPI